VLRDFKAQAPALDPSRSSLYLRYHLLVAHLLDDKGMTAEALLSGVMPPGPIEAEAGREVIGDGVYW
jgi:hypothetical protein